jgi:hypothetical protein
MADPLKERPVNRAFFFLVTDLRRQDYLSGSEALEGGNFAIMPQALNDGKGIFSPFISE